MKTNNNISTNEINNYDLKHKPIMTRCFKLEILEIHTGEYIVKLSKRDVNY